MARPSELTWRLSQETDAPFLKQWFSDPKILFGFPIEGEKEIEDTVRIWMEYVKKNEGITALWNGEPCGMAVLYIQNFVKLAHTCLFSILVDEQYRGKGVGTMLIEELISMAKNAFGIEILHLEVYDGNPAKRLYERMGFESYGEHPQFTKETDRYRTKIFMQKYLK